MHEFAEPGAARHGNFINYYDFNSATDRLNLLPLNSEIWTSKTADNGSYVVLDIGCNAGNITQLLYPFLRDQIGKDIFILGIDIDNILIDRASQNNKFPENITYVSCDITKEDSVAEIIPEYLKQFSKTKFDAVFCLSITMWIHLNNGDDGLKSFLNTVSTLASLLVIEPQPWKCYQNAVRRMKRAKAADTFPLFNLLQWRQNVEKKITEYLDNGCAINCIYESVPTKWNRKICFYRRK